MVEDVVRSLGHLCLGTRMKRIGERLQGETQRILDSLEVPIQAGQYPLLGAIDRLGPLTVGELASVPASPSTMPSASSRSAALMIVAFSRSSSPTRPISWDIETAISDPTSSATISAGCE